jgi:dienelactone hydrolase
VKICLITGVGLVAIATAFSIGAIGCASSESTTGDTAPSSAPDAGNGFLANDAGGNGNPASNDDGGAPSNNDGGPTTPPRADVPAVACTDAVDDVYTTPLSLPPFTPSVLGDVVRCAHDTDLALSDVQTELTGASIATPATTGVTIYRIAYRTTRGGGFEGSSSARVYLPKVARSLPLPVIVVAHPTVGLASSCAPSKDPTSMQDLALPWAALGYAVIAPDYAGLGNDDGVQGYVDNHDTAFSTLDGARALTKLLSPGALSSTMLAVGYSQGGGAVLSSQALAKTYASEFDLKGVIAFAPEWPTRPNSFGYIDMMSNPNELMIQNGISNPVVAAMRQFAYFSSYVGNADAADAVPSTARSAFSSEILSLCQTPFGGYVQGAFVHVGDMFDPAFRTALLACNSGDTANCVDPAKTYYAFMQQNVLTSDKTGAPVLFVQGLADIIMPAASEAACNVQKMIADGLTPQVCVDTAGQHTTIVPRNMDYALTWGEAILSGSALPACPAAGSLPTCTP